MKRINFEIPKYQSSGGDTIAAAAAWLDVRTPEELTNKGRKMVRAALTRVGKGMQQLEARQKVLLEELVATLPEGTEPTPEQLSEIDGRATTDCEFDEETLERMQSLQDVALFATIAGWSFPGEVTRDALDNMDLRSYDALEQAGKAAAAAVMQQLTVGFEPGPIPDPDAELVEASPTGA